MTTSSTCFSGEAGRGECAWLHVLVTDGQLRVGVWLRRAIRPALRRLQRPGQTQETQSIRRVLLASHQEQWFSLMQTLLVDTSSQLQVGIKNETI